MFRASDFLNTLGINTHAAFGTGAYQNSSLTIQALNYLGITDIRDGFRHYGLPEQTLNALANAGIKINFLVSTAVPGGGEASLANFIRGLETFLTKHPGSIIGVEGLNEANIYEFTYNGSYSMEAGAAFQKALYAAVQASGVIGHLPVLNMTVGYDDIKAYAALGDLSDYSDYTNVHTYTHTRYAADATQEYQISLAKTVNSKDPLVITETGYTTLESFNYLGVSETAQSKLILNGLLNSYENGSQKTYLYELFDGNSDDTVDSESHFGLFRTDGTAKPAATALHNLTTILSYGDEGDSLPTTALDYVLSDMPAKSHSLVFTKANGAYDLVLWAEPEIWDDINDVDRVNPDKTVTVELGGVFEKVYVYDPLTGTAPIAVYTNVSSITVPLSDHPVVIEIGATSPVTETVVTVAPDLTVTSAELVASIDYLANTEGLERVTLTDDGVLHVSSKATMLYMIANYQNVLSKIAGGYSFSVEQAQSTWRLINQYDASGTLTATVEQALSNGEITIEKTSYPDGTSYTERFKDGALTGTASEDKNGDITYATYKDGVMTGKIINHPNGSHETYDYGITGKNYTTQHQVFNASGKIQLLERTGDNGFSQVYKYDATTGKVISFTQRSTNGTESVYLYQSDGTQKSTFIRYADGSSESYDYGITGKNYTTQHQVFDANGKIALLERMRADGTFSYIEKHQTTQKIYYVYDKAGVLSEMTTVKLDGSKTNYLYATDGSGDYTYRAYNSDGVMTRKIVYDADGATVTTSYSGTDGTKTAVYIKYANGSAESYDYGITGKNYTTQHQVFDANGKLKVLERTGDSGFSQHYEYDTSTGKVISLQQRSVNGTESLYLYHSDGTQKSTFIRYANGSSESYDYGISGKNYATQHQVFGADGKIVLLERMRADGTFTYIEKHQATQKIYYVYDKVGVLSEMTTVKLDGSKTNYLYATDGSGDYTYRAYSSDGVLTTRTVHDEGVSDVTTKYVGGVKSSVYSSYADGTSESHTYKTSGSETYLYTHQTFDTKGKLVDLERYNADGSLSYTEARHDGAVTYGIYNAAGVKTETTTVEADGTRDSYFYSTTTPGMVTHKITAADGSTVLLDVKQGDGTHAVTAYAAGTALWGGVNDDVFTFKAAASGTVNYDGGNDKIVGFTPSLDQIDLADHLVSDLSQLDIYQSGADTIVFIDSQNSIALKNVALSSLPDGWITL